MPLALFACASDNARTLRVWAGLQGFADAPRLDWRLARASEPAVPAVPDDERALRDWNVDGRPSFRSGVFNFRELEPATTYRIELAVGDERVVRRFRTLPRRVPFASDDSFNLLLLSCFHAATDPDDVGARRLAGLAERTDLTLLAGDQVYLDLPTLRDFDDDLRWLEARFQGDYLRNWFGRTSGPLRPDELPGGFPQILALAPVVALPDDHEYWNNAPFRSPIVQNSYTAAGRARWREAAERAYAMFQLGTAAPMGTARRIDVDPVSILMLDTRSRRNAGRGDAPPTASMRDAPGDLLGRDGRDALVRWVDDLVASAGGPLPLYGFLVTGQSLFIEAAGAWKGDIADFALQDYAADHAFVVAQIERVSTAGLPLVCLTGDTHWGRVLTATQPGRGAIHEIVSSPTSLCETIVVDGFRTAVAKIRGFFGDVVEWPRHVDPQGPPPRFGVAKGYACTVDATDGRGPAAMRGNLAVMLRVKRLGPGLDVAVDYIPLHADDAVNDRRRWTTRFALRPRG